MAHPGGMPAALRQAIEDSPHTISADRLKRLRDLVAQTRDLEKRKSDLEEQLKEVSKQLSGEEGMYFHKLPDLMSELGVSVMTLEAEGNMPAVEAKAGPFYAANIAAGWPEEKRTAAFKWLDKNGHGDLIKTEVSVRFNREDRGRARAFAKLAKTYGSPEIHEAVAWNTLTAWLREQVEDKGYVPPLDIIGGSVGRSVKLKTKS